MNSLKILVPNGHLGYARSEKDSFYLGLKDNPDALAADSGSADMGPHPLGSGTASSPTKWQIHDLELMLVPAIQKNIPMVIGSANDTGTNQGVEKYAQIIRDLAQKHKLKKFKLATITYTLTKDMLKQRLNAGEPIPGLNGHKALTLEELEATTNLVPMMGAEPMLKALEKGADVVIASRSSDVCIFAALALWKGFPKNVAYYAGKVLECASFCAEPYMGKESVLGILNNDSVCVKAMHPEQRCTPASLASHSMYERASPYFEKLPGGEIDMRDCLYEQVDHKTTKVRGMKFNESKDYWIKIEGAAYVGERRYSIIGVRDPQTIANIDKAVAWARSKVKEQYGKDGEKYKLVYHIYGKNGVLGDMEPVKEIRSHELGIVVEAVSKDKQLAEDIVLLGARGLFYARLPTKGTAGGAAMLTDGVMSAPPVYRWSINHIIKVDNPLSLFKIKIETINGRKAK